MRRRAVPAVLLGLALLAAFAAPGHGQQPLGVDNRELLGEPQGTPIAGAELDRRTEELTSLMRCPVCQGLSIADSGTMIAQAMKVEVRQFLAAGYTEDQVLRYFERSYGEFIRLAPKPRGFNLVVWIAPLAALLGGVALLVWRLRPAGAAATTRQPAAGAEELDAYRERVRREVTS